MDIYVKVENGVVTNRTRAEAPLDGSWIASGTAQIGHIYNEGTETFSAPLPPPTPVPAKVTMRQARLALLQQGLLAQVQPAIDSLPEAERQAAQIEWDYSQAVERHNSFVNTLAFAMGLSETQLDDLFVYAETL